MEALKREMARKRKALQQAKQTKKQSGGGFLKAGELRQWEDEQREQEREQKFHSKKKTRLDQTTGTTKRDNDDKDQPSSTISTKNNENNNANKPQEVSASGRDPSPSSSSSSSKRFTSEEITKQLRFFGLAVRLFGERGDAARRERLEKALQERAKTREGVSEMQEFQLDRAYRIRNTFLEKESDNNKTTNRKMDSRNKGGDSNNDNNNSKNTLKDGSADDDNKEPGEDENDAHLIILKYFQGLLSDWETTLAQRSEQVKRSVAGRTETKTMAQCQDYIQPLFKACRKKQLEPNMLLHLQNIVTYAKMGEFVKAHDSYMDVAIGRAAWPIGVTMVGIHARTGRAKIESSNVAHVMNSELQRKYLTSVKRLLTFAQSQASHVDPSKKVG